MGAYLQPGSMSVDLVVQRDIEERIGRAREQEMVRAAKGARGNGLNGFVVRLNPARLVSAVRMAPVSIRARQALGG